MLTKTKTNPRNFLKFVELQIETEDVGGEHAAAWRICKHSAFSWEGNVRSQIN